MFKRVHDRSAARGYGTLRNIAVPMIVAVIAILAPVTAQEQVKTITAVPAADVGLPLPGHGIKGRPALEAISLVGGLPGPHEFLLIDTNTGLHDVAIDVNEYSAVPDVEPTSVNIKTWKAAMKDAAPATRPDSSAHVLVVGGENPRVDVIKAETTNGRLEVTYNGKEILTLQGAQPSVTMTAVEGARYGYVAYVRNGTVYLTAFPIPAVPSKPPTIALGRGEQPYITVVWACPLKAILAVTYLNTDGRPVTYLVHWDSVRNTLKTIAKITYEDIPTDVRYPEAAVRWQEVFLLYVHDDTLVLRVYTINGLFQFYDPNTGTLDLYDVNTGPVETYRFPKGKAPSYVGALRGPDGGILIAGTRAYGIVLYKPGSNGGLKPVEYLPHAAAVPFPLVENDIVKAFLLPNWGVLTPANGRVTPIPVYTSELKELGKGWIYAAQGHVYAAYRSFVSWVLDGNVTNVQGPEVTVILPVTDPVTNREKNITVTTVITARKVEDAYVTALAAPFIVNVEKNEMTIKIATPKGVITRETKIPDGAQLMTYLIGARSFYVVLQNPKGGYLTYLVDETEGHVEQVPVSWFGLVTRVNGGPTAVVLITEGQLVYTPPEFAVIVGELKAPYRDVHDVSVVGPGFLVTHGEPVTATWVSENRTLTPKTTKVLGIDVLDFNTGGSRWLVAVDPKNGTVITGYRADRFKPEEEGTIDIVLNNEPGHATLYNVQAGPTEYAVALDGNTVLICPLPDGARLENGLLRITDTAGGKTYTYHTFLLASGSPDGLQKAIAAITAYLEGWNATEVLSAQPVRYVLETHGRTIHVVTFHGTEPERFTVGLDANVLKITERWYLDPHTALLIVETSKGKKAVELDLADLRGAAYPAVTDENGLGVAFDDIFVTTWPPMQVLFFTVKPRLTTGEIPESEQVRLPEGATPLWVGSASKKGWTVIACLYVGPQGADAVAVVENGRQAHATSPSTIAIAGNEVQVTVPTPAGPVTLTYRIKPTKPAYPNQTVYTPLIVPVIPPRRPRDR